RDINEELDQLRQLRDAGALSEEEFRRAKASLLGESSAPHSGTDGPGYSGTRPKRSRAGTGEAPGKKRRRPGPRSQPSDGGLYRDSGKLVIREGAEFPARCVICNKECDGEPLDFTFGREGKSHYIEVAAIQTLARAAEDLVKGNRYTGPVQTAIPMCSWHRN